MLRTIAVLVALLPPVAFADMTGPARVIDGDTLEIAGERIRLHGIDAPESRQTCIASGERWSCGQKAEFALTDFIGDWPVRCEGQGTDRYGRTIATCYVRGEDIEAWMVVNGWALAYRRYSDDYVDEEAIAQDAQAGIWRGEFVPPWEWRRGVRLSSAAPDEAGQLSPAPAQPEVAVCCKICRKGKACGNSCIARWKTCHKPPGCACDAN